MLEINSFFSWKVVLEFNCIVIRSLVNKLFSSNHTTDFTIRSIESLDNNINFLVSFFHSNVSVFESKTSWEIFIQNGYFSDCIVTFKSVNGFLDNLTLSEGCNTINWFSMILRSLWSLAWVIELNKEVKIWLPFIIIYDWNMNFLLVLS